MDAKEVFNSLFHLDVTDKLEQKRSGGTTLSYLSWAYAWGEMKKIDPEATFTIKMFDDGNGRQVPYTYDPRLGIMVFTSVTSQGVTHDMWLPVMDGANKAMKFEPYEYTVRSGTKTVQPATMFDVNKTLMRCLVKNLGMFGLGLYIYQGEDLPEEDPVTKEELMKQKALAKAEELGYPELDKLKALSYNKIVAVMQEWKAGNK